MKVLIKKYFQFEKQFGTITDINRAKERITQYVKSNDDNNSMEQTEFVF